VNGARRSENIGQNVNQALVLVSGPGCDAKEVVDSRLVKMAHDHPLFPQPSSESLSGMIRMLRKDEVGG
jgi:hypothetical protein